MPTKKRPNGWYRCRLNRPVFPMTSDWLALYWRNSLWIGVNTQEAVVEVGERIWMPDEEPPGKG